MHRQQFIIIIYIETSFPRTPNFCSFLCATLTLKSKSIRFIRSLHVTNSTSNKWKMLAKTTVKPLACIQQTKRGVFKYAVAMQYLPWSLEFFHSFCTSIKFFVSSIIMKPSFSWYEIFANARNPKIHTHAINSWIHGGKNYTLRQSDNKFLGERKKLENRWWSQRCMCSISMAYD